MKKFSAVLIAIFMLIFAAGCGENSGGRSHSNLIGITLPDQTVRRWIKDGDHMKELLEKKGYHVDLEYAENNIDMQISQIDDMIKHGAKCIVVSAVDSTKLLDVLNKAKKNNIPVIAYDRLLMDTDAVSYYATFDNKGVGILMGEYVEEKLGLKEGKGPYNIEFFAGSHDDNNAHFVNSGVFEVLQPYIDKGQLIVPSGQTDFDLICTLRWSQEVAQKRMDHILAEYYKDDKKVDAVIVPNDRIGYGIGNSLANAGYKVGENWPLITGQDAELQAARYILSGRQAMTVFKDTRVLAEKCVNMIEAVLNGTEPEINDTTSFDNHKFVVPAYLCTPVVLDKNNVKEILVGSGYYTEAALESNEN